MCLKNHDACITKLLKEVNSRAKIQSHKTRNSNIPVEQTSFAKKPERHIPKRHRSSIKKTSVVHEKIMTPRSCLRWKPTGKIFKTVGLKWVPTGKIFTSSTTKVDSEPTNGSNDDITNQYACKQTLDVSAGTLNIHAGTSLNPTKEGLRVKFKAGSKSCSSSRQDSYITTRVGITISPSHNNAEGRMPTKIELTLEQSQQGVSNDVLMESCLSSSIITYALGSLRSYTLSWKPCQGHPLNLPDHRIHKDGDGDALFQLKSDSLPHAHAQTTKTYYKHRDSRIMKAQELKTKTSAQTLIYKIFLQRYQVYQGRLLASFQDDAKYEHVGQDTRSQGGKDDQDGRIKI
ncbi:hypothetical protein Tco_1254660 [Tanacetum coccineum]